MSSVPGGPPVTSGGLLLPRPASVIPSSLSFPTPPPPPPPSGPPAFCMAPFAPAPPPPAAPVLSGQKKNIPQPSNPLKSFNWNKLPEVHSLISASTGANVTVTVCSNIYCSHFFKLVLLQIYCIYLLLTTTCTYNAVLQPVYKDTGQSGAN